MQPTAPIEDLEHTMALGWWPLEHAFVGGWLLRASGGFTGRGNSALAAGDPGMSLETAIAHVEAFYRARGLPPRFAVPTPDVGATEGGLADLLAPRGYAVVTPTAVMTAAAQDVVARLSTRVTGGPSARVRLDSEPADDWLRVYRYRGQDLPTEARSLLLSAPHQVFAAVRRGAATIAVGRLAVAAGWGGITAMEVVEDHRGQGHARRVLAALAAYATQQDVLRLYLQVSADNEPARSLYRSAGFADHHGYHYRLLDAGAVTPRSPT